MIVMCLILVSWKEPKIPARSALQMLFDSKYSYEVERASTRSLDEKTIYSCKNILNVSAIHEDFCEKQRRSGRNTCRNGVMLKQQCDDLGRAGDRRRYKLLSV